MSNPSTALAVLLIGFVAAGFAPPPAEISTARVDAIVKCIAVAHTRYPDDGDAQHRGRYLAYEECMTDAGQAP